MRILGIESASLVASVAIVTDDVITAEYTVNLQKNAFADTSSDD